MEAFAHSFQLGAARAASSAPPITISYRETAGTFSTRGLAPPQMVWVTFRRGLPKIPFDRGSPIQSNSIGIIPRLLQKISEPVLLGPFLFFYSFINSALF